MIGGCDKSGMPMSNLDQEANTSVFVIVSKRPRFNCPDSAAFMGPKTPELYGLQVFSVQKMFVLTLKHLEM